MYYERSERNDFFILKLFWGTFVYYNSKYAKVAPNNKLMWLYSEHKNTAATVKPVYKDHSREPEQLICIYRL